MSVFFCKVFGFSLCFFHWSNIMQRGRKNQHLQAQNQFSFQNIISMKWDWDTLTAEVLYPCYNTLILSKTNIMKTKTSADNHTEINQMHLNLLEALSLYTGLKSILVHASYP